MDTKEKKKNMEFVFDLDNTLIYTDEANNVSYREAVRCITGIEVQSDYDGRITRENLHSLIPQLSVKQFAEITKEKERIYSIYLNKTHANKLLIKLLSIISKSNLKPILLTNSRRNRAENLLKYHGLYNLFHQRYYIEDYPDCNKYQYLINSLKIECQNVVLFENEQESIRDAIQYNINENNILSIK